MKPLRPLGILFRRLVRPPPSPAPAAAVDGSSPDRSTAMAAALAAPLSDPHRKTVAFLVAGGLAPKDARRVAAAGLTAASATDLLSVSLLHPPPERFGPAAMVMSLLMEARSVGVLSAKAVAARIDRVEGALMLRPDGYLAPVMGGPGLEPRGDLQPGVLYRARGGVLRELDGDGTPVAELGLGRTDADAFLDGVESALGAQVFAMVAIVDGLIERPEETLDALAHGFGGLPAAMATAIRRSPAMLETYQRASGTERTRMVGSALTHAYMFATGLAAIPRTGAALGIQGGAGTVMSSTGLLSLRATGVAIRLDAQAFAVAGAQIAFGGAALAESLDLVASLTPGMGPTTLADPKGRVRARARIKRALANPNDPNLSLKELERMIADADVLLDKTAAKELRAIALQKVQRHLRTLESMPDDLRKATVETLADFSERTNIDLRDAARRLARPPDRSSLSLEARQALRSYDRGAVEITVGQRKVAEEVLTQLPRHVETGGLPKSEIKRLFGSDDITFHWDDVFGEDGFLLRHKPENPHAKTPHLQVHGEKGRIVRFFFEESLASSRSSR